MAYPWMPLVNFVLEADEDPDHAAAVAEFLTSRLRPTEIRDLANQSATRRERVPPSWPVIG